MYDNSPLKKKTSYTQMYSPQLLFPILRKEKRDELNIKTLPFDGYDVWNAYELSWLNLKGKPQVALAEFVFPVNSKNIIESKSFKLYLNSLNNMRYESMDMVQTLLQKDLSACVDDLVTVRLFDVNTENMKIKQPMGMCLDVLDVSCDSYQVNTNYLFSDDEVVCDDIVYSNLLKSNCLVTEQPDWGTVVIQYSGKRINYEGLLKYIVSFRNHNEFHEQCVERIFMDLTRCCDVKKLCVRANYTRRGGLDINPIRASLNYSLPEKSINYRFIRQ